MKLTFEKIKECTLGAARVEKSDTGVSFFRFTKKEEKFYYITSPTNFYLKTFSNAGVRISFKTDSKNMLLKISARSASSRTYFGVDVAVDGKLIGGIYNYEELDLSGNYTTIDCPLGEFSKELALGDGIKEVTLFMPWSVALTLCELSLDDGALCEPKRPDKLMIAYGDSITHGYDALCPSNRYAAKLADALGAEEINKAIGGDIFEPTLAEIADDLKPDYITVAYGTNDWAKCNPTIYFDNCRDFYSTLSKKYPSAKIFAITPIWRADCQEQKRGGSFFELEARIAKATADLQNVILIPGIDFVPKDELMYADLRLHPHDEGFDHYFKNLFAKIKRFL